MWEQHRTDEQAPHCHDRILNGWVGTPPDVENQNCFASHKAYFNSDSFSYSYDLLRIECARDCQLWSFKRAERVYLGNSVR